MTRSLLPGDWVQVRSAGEIAQILDADSATEGLPFMPEMLPFAGRRFKVVQRAELTCVHRRKCPSPGWRTRSCWTDYGATGLCTAGAI
jgi:hypothetical protein